MLIILIKHTHRQHKHKILNFSLSIRGKNILKVYTYILKTNSDANILIFQYDILSDFLKGNIWQVWTHLVDGWQTSWPRSWEFWLWVLTSSGRMAGVAYCTSALLLKFPHLPVHSICGRVNARQKTNTRINKWVSEKYPIELKHTCQFRSVLHRCVR